MEPLRDLRETDGHRPAESKLMGQCVRFQTDSEAGRVHGHLHGISTTRRSPLLSQQISIDVSLSVEHEKAE